MRKVGLIEEPAKVKAEVKPEPEKVEVKAEEKKPARKNKSSK